jgi:predicted adenylyl cyclase CyaB
MGRPNSSGGDQYIAKMEDGRILNVEIKAKCGNLGMYEEKLRKLGAELIRIEEQKDTYFSILDGRLKVRELPATARLIYYVRENISEPKKSEVLIFDIDDMNRCLVLMDILKRLFPIRCIVRKSRKIYGFQNIHIHLDRVEGLGSFLELEGALQKSQTITSLRKQVGDFQKILGIKKEDLLNVSYSDMLQYSKN